MLFLYRVGIVTEYYRAIRFIAILRIQYLDKINTTNEYGPTPYKCV